MTVQFSAKAMLIGSTTVCYLAKRGLIIRKNIFSSQMIMLELCQWRVNTNLILR